MSYGKISAKQKEILEYIKQSILSHGYPPAVREICEAVHLKSTSSVHSHLETLEKNGYIRRDPSKPRAIEIIDDNFNLTRRELVNVPIVGTVTAGEPILAIENIQGYFPIPCIVGAVVGAVVSGFSYVLTSGGEIDGVELAKSCLVGAVSGVLAPLKGGFLMAAAIVNGINTAINTEGDPVTRVVYGIIEGGVTYIAGNRANKVTDMVQFESKAAEALGNAAVNYSIGQPMELAATGVSAAAKPVTKAIAKNMGIATSNARTTKRSNTRVITTVSGRKKVINKVKKPTRRNTKFQRVCMA